MGEISTPEPITTAHLTEPFSCGIPVLDEWLKRRALKNEVSGASRTFVVCHDRRVIGYYALATGSIRHSDAPGNIRRNMPDPIPVMVLGRLAVDQQWQHAGLGRGLLKMRCCVPCQCRNMQESVHCSFMHSLMRPKASMSTMVFLNPQLTR